MAHSNNKPENDRRKTTQKRIKEGFMISGFEDNGYIEVLGPGTMNTAPILKDISHAMIDEGKKTIFLNMNQCDYVDSTFMGTLVNIQERFGKKGMPDGKILLINMKDDHKKLFRMVGIDNIIESLPDEVDVPDFDLKVIEDCDVAREEKLKVVVEAHEKLVQLNEVNKEKFENFVNVVKQEMKDDGMIGDE